MSTVSSVDYVGRRIYLSATTVGQPLDTTQVYRDVRALRRITEAHRKFRPMIVAGGNIQKTASTFTQPYVQLLFGCRIVPYDTPHTLIVIRDTFSDDGQAGVGCFDRASLASNVDVDFQVAPVEVRIIAGGSGLTIEQSQFLQEIYSLLGLDPNKPLVVSSSQRTAGAGIIQTIVDNGTSMTVTRTP